MENYLFKLDKELFEWNAMEMDDALLTFFKNADVSDERFEMENDKGVRRKFKIDWDEKLLEGRGIKGFFADYPEGYLTIGRNEDATLKVSRPTFSENDVMEDFRNKEQGQAVLQALANYTDNGEKWFQLYQIAEPFRLNPGHNQLISLPYVRDLDTYEYQVKAVQSVIHRFKGRVMLSDEVGLGKTVEAGLAMLEYIMRGLVRRILILVPPSLVSQWEDEMKRKFNQNFIRADHPDFKNMGQQAWGHYPKVIASIDTAKRKNHREAIFKEHYDLIIVDEAHHLKNRTTQKWKFVNGINKKYIFLLTATPVQNHLEELYNLITLLKPGQLRTYSYFKKNFIGSKDGIEVKNADKLKGLLNDVMIRNKRSNVDVTFTKRTAYTRAVDLTPQEKSLYDDISSFIRNTYKEKHPVLNQFRLKNLQEQIGSTITGAIPSLEKLAVNEKLTEFERKTMLRFLERAKAITNEQAGDNQKVEELESILTEFNDKMIVFTKFASTQKYISEWLKERGFKVATFHGGLRRKEKEEQVAYFKDEAQVLVSTEIGGEGRNLQFCHGMINFDLPWNPMAIEQRIGRIHRIGQENDVTVYNLVAKDTIEYYILDLLDRKINMFELVVGEVDAILGDLEEKEEFSDQVMKAWVHAESKKEVAAELEEIGEEMLKNKEKLSRQKKIDETLF